MAGPSRIDELRKKFDENPRRYFAPLANEYRKLGDFEQAIFICQEFLPQQPGHMSGHIVYGQALFETGRHDEARSVFETALALDPENLIALRHLGDIARAHGDTETARAWYRRVLESDPRNEEIAGILTALDAGEVAPMATAPPATQPQAAQAAPEAASAPVESSPTPALSDADSRFAPPPQRSEPQPAVPAQAPPPAADPIVSEPLTSPPPSESNFDDIAKLFTTATPSPTSNTGPLELIHEGEDILGHPDEQNSPEAAPIKSPSSGASSGFSAFSSAEDAVPSGFQSAFLDHLTSSEAAPPPEPEAAQAVKQTEPPPAAPPVDASVAFVTETMAELYVQQGHIEQAVDVYRKLVKLHPNDSALAARLRSVEASRAQPEKERSAPAPAPTPAPPPAPAPISHPAPEPEVLADAGPTIREFLGVIADFRPRVRERSDDVPVAQSAPEPAAREATVSGSLHSLFAEAERKQESPNHDGMAAAAPRDDAPAPEPSSLRGRPATPAANELSLDHVFRHATPATGSSAQSGFSFDQFFSHERQEDAAPSDAESAESGGPQTDDIQQFNAWLEGLKKT